MSAPNELQQIMMRATQAMNYKPPTAEDILRGGEPVCYPRTDCRVLPEGTYWELWQHYDQGGKPSLYAIGVTDAGAAAFRIGEMQKPIME